MHGGTNNDADQTFRGREERLCNMLSLLCRIWLVVELATLGPS